MVYFIEEGKMPILSELMEPSESLKVARQVVEVANAVRGISPGDFGSFE